MKNKGNLKALWCPRLYLETGTGHQRKSWWDAEKGCGSVNSDVAVVIS